MKIVKIAQEETEQPKWPHTIQINYNVRFMMEGLSTAREWSSKVKDIRSEGDKFIITLSSGEYVVHNDEGKMTSLSDGRVYKIMYVDGHT